MDAAARFKNYIEKIATGPRMSEDLTAEEAEDAIASILGGGISAVRAGIFLIAARMKRETLAENIGYWRALDKTTERRRVDLPRLLQVADPFDGFTRAPYFGFFALPVIAALGLPVYGHSSLPAAPKFGLTFAGMLRQHYAIASLPPLDEQARLVETLGFTYLSLEQTNPKLAALRDLRAEMIKRTALSTFEKMLMPLAGDDGGNVLATTYFHKGYEEPMIAVARLSRFDRVIIGNGLESTTFFGAHKPARVFLATPDSEPAEMPFSIEKQLPEDAAARVRGAWLELKDTAPDPSRLAALGEAALRGGNSPAAPLIAWQAASLCFLAGDGANAHAGFNNALSLLKTGVCYERLMRLLERCRAAR